MTNEELTAIYNEANGLDPKRHNPITTERIFTAMRAAMSAERTACMKACADVREGGNGTPKQYEDNHADGFTDGCNECEWTIGERSNE